MKMSQKILYVTRPLQEPWDEASKVFARDLATHVTDTDITILTSGTVEDLTPAENSLVTQESIYTESENDFSLIQKIRLILWLIKNAKEYDVIHLLFTPTKLNAWILKHILPRNAHIIQTIATIRKDLYEPEQYKDIFFGDTLITYSQFAYDTLEENGFTNITHIYPGIDLNQYTPKEKDQDLLAQWNIPSENLVVTYPGEFTRLGATDMIIDAFLELWKDKTNHHITYLCACRVKNSADQAKKNKILAQVTAAGHADKIAFSGTFSGGMNSLYNISDIIIYPASNMHGKFDVPLAMIEPYACKKPVIASDLPVFSEFSSAAINVIIPKDDPNALVSAIRDLSQDPTKRDTLGANASQFLQENFDIKSVARKYSQLYKNIS